VNTLIRSGLDLKLDVPESKSFKPGMVQLERTRYKRIRNLWQSILLGHCTTQPMRHQYCCIRNRQSNTAEHSGVSVLSRDNTIGSASLSKHLAQIVCQFIWFFIRRKVSPAVVLKFGYDPIASPNPAARKTRRYINQVSDWIRSVRQRTYAFGKTMISLGKNEMPIGILGYSGAIDKVDSPLKASK